jgi:hypothetical protein
MIQLVQFLKILFKVKTSVGVADVGVASRCDSGSTKMRLRNTVKIEDPDQEWKSDGSRINKIPNPQH